MERDRHGSYPVAVADLQHIQQFQKPNHTNQVTMQPQQQQSHTINHRLKSHAALVQVDPQTVPQTVPQTAPQAEYVDISRNQPSTSAMTPLQSDAFRTEVRDLAYKLNMKRSSVEKWLREKYNRTHPHDRIVHPRCFKFSDDQRRRLNEFFEQDRYPKPHEMEILAFELQCKKEQIKNWFHDQRRKCKRNEQLANKEATSKRSRFSAQKRKKLEDFFERNFHPYPGDSRRMVNEFELREGRTGHASRYSHDASVRYEYGNHMPKSKRVPQTRGFKFSEDQRRQLRDSYMKNKYPTTFEMQQMAQSMGVLKVQIKNWFHDHRRKVKKEQMMAT